MIVRIIELDGNYVVDASGAAESLTQTTPASSGTSGTTVDASEVALGFICQKRAEGQASPTNSFTLLDAVTSSPSATAADRIQGGVYKRVLTATGAYETSVTITARVWIGRIVTFKAAAAGTTFFKTFDAGITPAGAGTKETEKPLSASVTPAGTVTKATFRAIAAGLTPTASVNRAVFRAFSADLTPTATLDGQIIEPGLALTMEAALTFGVQLDARISHVLAAETAQVSFQTDFAAVEPTEIYLHAITANVAFTGELSFVYHPISEELVSMAAALSFSTSLTAIMADVPPQKVQRVIDVPSVLLVGAEPPPKVLDGES
jgi:hypothetical protein